MRGALSFLREAALGGPPAPGGDVVVVGGGNSAIDAARTALRCGARTVTIAYRRGEREMPALAEEVAAAREEGVAFRFLTAPLACRGAGGRVVSLRCAQMRLGAADGSGRRRPEPLKGSEHEIPADRLCRRDSRC